MVVSHRPPVFSQKISADAFVFRAFRRFCYSRNPLTYSPKTGIDFIGKPEASPSPF